MRCESHGILSFSDLAERAAARMCSPSAALAESRRSGRNRPREPPGVLPWSRPGGPRYRGDLSVGLKTRAYTGAMWAVGEARSAV
jgi:hypothetical protein